LELFYDRVFLAGKAFPPLGIMLFVAWVSLFQVGLDLYQVSQNPQWIQCERSTRQRWFFIRLLS
ncbi:MAG: hypothetical protein WBA24_00855, partial [Geitlerinemataceae cyanobacterium]